LEHRGIALQGCRHGCLIGSWYVCLNLSGPEVDILRRGTPDINLGEGEIEASIQFVNNGFVVVKKHSHIDRLAGFWVMVGLSVASQPGLALNDDDLLVLIFELDGGVCPSGASTNNYNVGLDEVIWFVVVWIHIIWFVRLACRRDGYREDSHCCGGDGREETHNRTAFEEMDEYSISRIFVDGWLSLSPLQRGT
jgi:hypothetical protein